MHYNIIDLTEKRFGRLTVVRPTLERSGSSVIWECLCDCGNVTFVPSHSLLWNQTKSCGCFRKDRLTTHGRSYNYLYYIWVSINQRCYNIKNSNYENYGGRGIRVCDRWKNSFENFLKDMGERPSKSYTIDRINNDGNYTPSNCRWATRKQQNNNRRKRRYSKKPKRTRIKL